MRSVRRWVIVAITTAVLCAHVVAELAAQTNEPRHRSRQFRIPTGAAAGCDLRSQSDAPHSAAEWFNIECFTLPAPFTFGNAERNSVLSPGYANFDVAIAKDLGLPKNARVELRWEIFNVFNTANFDVPNRIFGTPNFGRIFSALPARQMQLGVKLQF